MSDEVDVCPCGSLTHLPINGNCPARVGAALLDAVLKLRRAMKNITAWDDDDGHGPYCRVCERVVEIGHDGWCPAGEALAATAWVDSGIKDA